MRMNLLKPLKPILLCIVSVSIIATFISPALSLFPQDTERITDFHSEIKINNDSTLTVTETIKVRTLGYQFRHGIYRDLITTRKDALGTNYSSDINIITVLKSGKEEPYHMVPCVNGKRLYIGDKEKKLKRGSVYTYKIKYKIDRQIRFFDDRDELYWNITGNEWYCPIDNASASIVLPESIDIRKLVSIAYTGKLGAKGSDYYKLVKENSRRINFDTTSTLDPGEGLTISIGFPKGIFEEPSIEQKAMYLVSDNQVLFLGIGGLLILLIYYLIVWAEFGRDIPRGTVIPMFEPPEILSPAAMRFIRRMGYDNRVFATSLVNMAVKGFITITQTADSIQIARYVPYDDFRKYNLSPEEEVIARTLLYFDDWFEFDSENHEQISKTIESIQNKLEREYEQKYFLSNTAYLVPGLFLSAGTLIGMILLQISEGGIYWIEPFVYGAVFSTMAVSAFLYAVFPHFRKIATGRGNSFLSLSAGVFGLLMFLFLGAYGISYIAESSNVFMGLFAAGFILVNVIFYHLLKAPTHEGRKVIDQIEGFRMFLSVAEADDMNLHNPPDKTPELFERYMPYALALDVEQAWCEQFAEIVEAAAAVDGRENPSWFNGSTMHSRFDSVFISSIASDISNSITSGSSAKSSSGFNPGGGGAGLGGGW
jgi:hypothetical protein